MDSDTPPQLGHEPRPLGRGAVVVALIITLFAGAHFGLRTLVTPSVHGDDADLIVFDQTLQLGYHAQPPLYSWLFRGVTTCFGRNLLSLNLLRTVLLAAAAWMTYLSARRLVRNEKLAVLGAYSAMAAPVVAWHAITYLTHTLLVCVACMAALHASLRVVQRGRWADYVWLGGVCGFGVLSKYNFAVFALALLTAGVAVKPLRDRLLSVRMAVAVLLAMLIVAPHAWWLTHNLDAIRGEYSHKLNGAATSSVAYALVDLVKNYLLLAAPTVAIFAACFPNARRSLDPRRLFGSPIEAWFAGYFAAVLAIYAMSIIATDAGRFHERWLEPLFLMLPLLLLCVVDRLGVSELGLRRLGATLTLLALTTVVVRAGQVWVGNSHRGYISMDYTYEDVAFELDLISADDAVLVVEDHEIGGNLLNSRGDLACVCADHAAYTPSWSQNRDEYVLIWDAKLGDQAPDRLGDYLRGDLGFTPLVADEASLVHLPPLFRGQKSKRLYYQRVSRPASVRIGEADSGSGVKR